MNDEDSWKLEIKFGRSGAMRHIKELKGSRMTSCLQLLLSSSSLLILYFRALLITRKGWKKTSSAVSSFGRWGMFVCLQNPGKCHGWSQRAGGIAVTSYGA